MERIFDLPAHPLFVHAPVVLLPLTCIATILFMFKRTWRYQFRWQLAVATLVVAVATFLTTQSGEALDEALKGLAPVDKHAELAEFTEILCFVLFLLALGNAVVLQRLHAGVSLPTRTENILGETGATLLETVLTVLIAFTAVLATVWMIRTGHEGARVVWTGTIK
jgi:uncharacterized membrane protein